MSTALSEEESASRANDTAEKFIRLYYKRLDLERHKIGNMYLDTATMAWNGNSVEGSTNIQQFLLSRIPSSGHTVASLDAQPVVDEAVAGQTTVVVAAAGCVKYKGVAKARPFQQNFMLTAQEDKWKVVTDVFRSQEPDKAAAVAAAS